MGKYLETTLNKYGVETRAVELGTQVLDGQTVNLPPAILGRIGNDPSKKTVLIYGHFDVQPVRESLSCRLLRILMVFVGQQKRRLGY